MACINQILPLMLMGICSTKLDAEQNTSTYLSAIIEKTTSKPSINFVTKSITPIMFPGTKWCGTRHTAVSYRDLGSSAQLDFCCREHDTCLDVINPGRSDHGLVNPGFFRASSCDCDKQFYNCLGKVDTVMARTVGYIYFSVLRLQCFRKEYPIVKCKNFEPGLYLFRAKRCVEYVFDKTKEKRFQWFDSPFYDYNDSP